MGGGARQAVPRPRPTPAPPPKAQAAVPPPESPFKFGTVTPAPDPPPTLAQAQAEHAANQPRVKPHEADVAPAPATPTSQELAGSLLKRGRRALDRTKEQGTPRAPVVAKEEEDPDDEIMRMKPEDVPDPDYVVDLEAEAEDMD